MAKGEESSNPQKGVGSLASRQRASREMAMARVKKATENNRKKINTKIQKSADGTTKGADVERTRSRNLDSKINKDVKSSGMNQGDIVKSVNKAGENARAMHPSLDQIAIQIRKDANAKKNTGSGGKPRDRRAAARKAAQTRKMRGGGQGKK